MNPGSIPADGAADALCFRNRFELLNQAEITLDYRLLNVGGLPQGPHYDKQINQLAKMVSYQTRRPVALVPTGSGHALALPADVAAPAREQPLTPHVAILSPSDDVYQLTLENVDESSAPIAISFIGYALRTPLMNSHDLWQSGRAYFERASLTALDHKAEVDVFPGFTWSIVLGRENRISLSLDATFSYVERRWLSEYPNPREAARFGTRVLYHFGQSLYVVQIVGVTGQSISEQKFIAGGRGIATDVFTYTRAKWANAPAPWISSLDPNSPAITYRNPGSEQERYGALSLCKRALSTTDPRLKRLHRYSILDPAPRLRRIRDVVKLRFSSAHLNGQTLKFASEPEQIPRRVFPVPGLTFGRGARLEIGSGVAEDGVVRVPLANLGKARMELLLSPTAGPYVRTPFDAQYLLWPSNSPRAINEDFERRFVSTMRQLSGQPAYNLKRILYDDGGPRTLYRQVRAVTAALNENQIDRGYALVVLPEGAAQDLHNFLKTKLWPNVQLQCATAAKLVSYYDRSSGKCHASQEGKLRGFVRNCALGMMVLNRKWAWTLTDPLHYEVYVGIDVLNQMAGLTFVYRHASNIFFRHAQCKHKERLTTAQLRELLTTHIREDAKHAVGPFRSLVIHRDGRSFESELQGLDLAAADLMRDGILTLDAVVGSIDIRKRSSEHTRIFMGPDSSRVTNPQIGTAELSGREGVICTTGLPFTFPGTASPLSAVIAHGNLNLEHALEDIFRLSQLTFTAPESCNRLPLTQKLTDDLLEPISSESDDEAALYEQEISEDEGGHDETPTDLEDAQRVGGVMK